MSNEFFASFYNVVDNELMKATKLPGQPKESVLLARLAKKSRNSHDLAVMVTFNYGKQYFSSFFKHKKSIYGFISFSDHCCLVKSKRK